MKIVMKRTARKKKSVKMRKNKIGIYLCSLILIGFSGFLSASPMPDITFIDMPKLSLRGVLSQGGIVVGTVPSDSQLWLDDRHIKTSLKGGVVFGFGRDAKLQHSLKLVLNSGEVYISPIVLKKRKYHLQKITGIAKKIMHPNNRNLTRIRKETKAVKSARNTDSTLTHFLEGFTWPLIGPITGVYGSQRFFNGEPKRPHFGVDVASPVGTKIRAPQAGIVSLASDLFYSGGTIIIDHGYGLNTSFLHLSKMLVKNGQKVEQGDVIGLVGKKGRATGAHLDWRVNWYQTRMDAEFIVGKMPLLKK